MKKQKTGTQKKQTTATYGEKHDRNTWKIIIMATETYEKIDDVTICGKKIETTGTYEKIRQEQVK